MSEKSKPINKMAFKNQYKHPLWQKKRLEVLQWAGFACQSCGADDQMLHVHHKSYAYGRSIWDYENENFTVLCEACHEELHVARDAMKQLVEGMAHLSSCVALVRGFVRADVDVSATNHFCFSDDVAEFKIGEIAYTLANLVEHPGFLEYLDANIADIYRTWVAADKLRRSELAK